jgi:glycosyltransferase involved in cell wall biosynthesis
MTGFQSGAALASIYKHAGLFALPSSHEGMPIALLEAMSFGLRVVVSDIEANLDLKLPANVYHKVEDVDDLAAALSTAIQSPAPDWSREMDQYQWSKIADKTVAAYRIAT